MIEEIDWSAARFDSYADELDAMLEAVASRPWYQELAMAIDKALDRVLGAK